jgi:hypothetical protein
MVQLSATVVSLTQENAQSNKKNELNIILELKMHYFI